MSIKCIEAAWTHLADFLSTSGIPPGDHASYGVLYGLAWAPATRGSEQVDQHCAVHKLLPVKTDEKFTERLAALTKAPFETDESPVQVEITPVVSPIRTVFPLLYRLAGHVHMSHVTQFPRAHFSHLYISSKMNEFATTYFALLHKASGAKRKEGQEEKMDAKDLDYAVLSSRDCVAVYGEKSLLECFLCYLGAQFYEMPLTRLTFFYHHLPLRESPLLSYHLVSSQISECRPASSSDMDRFSKFCAGGGSGMPPKMCVMAPRLKREAVELEVPLLWLSGLAHTHTHDVSNTYRKHGFTLSERDLTEQRMALELVDLVRDVQVFS